MSFIFSNFVVQFNMILERQVELLVLDRILRDIPEEYCDNGMFDTGEITLDVNKMVNRLDELIREFIDPYVIDNAPKGD